VLQVPCGIGMALMQTMPALVWYTPFAMPRFSARRAPPLQYSCSLRWPLLRGWRGIVACWAVPQQKDDFICPHPLPQFGWQNHEALRAIHIGQTAFSRHTNSRGWLAALCTANTASCCSCLVSDLVLFFCYVFVFVDQNGALDESRLFCGNSLLTIAQHSASLECMVHFFIFLDLLLPDPLGWAGIFFKRLPGSGLHYFLYAVLDRHQTPLTLHMVPESLFDV